jgi:hypothetical protein
MASALRFVGRSDLVCDLVDKRALRGNSGHENRRVSLVRMGMAKFVGLEENDSDWMRAHAALSRLARARALADAEEGRWLLLARRSAAHVHLGFGSFGEYVERLFGYTPRSTQEKLRVAEALEGLPRLAQALEVGSLSWSALRELTRVAVADTEREWLELAQGKTIRQLEELVAGKSPGDAPSAAGSASARRRVLRFEVAPETFALFREAVGWLRRRGGDVQDDDSVLLSMARHVLGGPADDGRSSYQIALAICPACGRGQQQAHGELVSVGADLVSMAHCDAQHLGHVSSRAANQNASMAGVETARAGRVTMPVVAPDPGCGASSHQDSSHVVDAVHVHADQAETVRPEARAHTNELAPENARARGTDTGNTHATPAANAHVRGTGPNGNIHATATANAHVGGTGVIAMPRANAHARGTGASGHTHATARANAHVRGTGANGNTHAMPTANAHVRRTGANGNTHAKPTAKAHVRRTGPNGNTHATATANAHVGGTGPNGNTHAMPRANAHLGGARLRSAVAPAENPPAESAADAPARAHVGRSDPRTRAKQTIPPALRRAVLLRDQHRCQAPGCRNATFLDLHHVQLRSEGGPNVLGNIITLCGSHHRAVHRGVLLIDKDAALGARFRHADGTLYGNVLEPQALDVQAKLFSALRHLGFKEREVRAVLAELRAGTAIRDVSLQGLLREALRRLRPPQPRP